MQILCIVSLGELLDKISILKIKQEKIANAIQLDYIHREVEELEKLIVGNKNSYTTWIDKLYQVNLKLWDIEDQIRLKENQQDFDAEFIALARSVYITNDLRFTIKNEINVCFGSLLKEQKSYKDYSSAEV